jgi:hypothetical protein
MPCLSNHVKSAAAFVYHDAKVYLELQSLLVIQKCYRQLNRET